jgi:1-aminocyclopropane-1-carboxylate deaminase/D-cysteine desulfhydrase-like pyridoxal-dependent ACC family enzyme
MDGSALARRYPALALALPRIVLGDWPTPLEPAPTLAAELGLTELLIKRDDRSAPHYGGNKVRKLEYLLADALERGCDCVVTYGSVGSNHALATAVFAARLGLGCHAVLVDQPASPTVARKLRFLVSLGASIHHAANFSDSRGIFESIRAAHPGGAERVADIPWGGSNWLGATGFVAAALELLDQLHGNQPDYVYLAGGTMGTAVGVSLGLGAAGIATRVVAPSAVPGGQGSTERVRRMMVETNRELHARDASFPLIDEPLRHLEQRPEFFGRGYAEPTAEGQDARALVERLSDVRLEDTYTGKAIAGLVADARSGRLSGRRVVYWHTYSSAPYPPDLDAIGPEALPPSLRHYLG